MSITAVSAPSTPTLPTATGNDASAAVQDFATLLQGQLSTAQADLPITDAAPAAPPTDAASLLAALGLNAKPNDAAPADLAPAEAKPSDATPIDAAASMLAALGLGTMPTDAKSSDAASADQAPADAKPINAAASILAAFGLGTTPTDAKSGDAASAGQAPVDAQPSDAAASMLAALGLATTPTIASAQNLSKADPQAGEPLVAVSGSAGQSQTAQGAPLTLNAAAAQNATAPTDDQAANFAAMLATAEETGGAKSDSATTSDNVSSLTNNFANHTINNAVHRDSSLAINTPVHDRNWATDMSQKVVWLANADKQSAQLTLNPPEMGPIEISLDVDKGTASVSFTSANAEVRDALETALPRLREMFASAGIELGQTNVGAQSFSQQQAGNSAQNQSSSRGRDDNAILAADTTGTLKTGALAARQGNGMVDLFA